MKTGSSEQTIAVLDFGGQYAQLIARRVRDNHVHSVLCGPHVTAADLRRMNVVGIIFSGGPASVYADNAPRCRPELLDLGVPILGICYGMQLICEMLGGQVVSVPSREFGRTILQIDTPETLLGHLPSPTSVWMSHGDSVQRISDDFERMAQTPACLYAAVRHRTRPLYGLQFHPEVTHTPHGNQIIRNFLYSICGCTGDWQIGNVIRDALASVSSRVRAENRVILGLSGGVDSSVTAALLHQALGDRLVCIFVDTGLLRTAEADLVEQTFREHFHIDLRVIDAAERFLSALTGVIDPAEKRRIIGRTFIEVFKTEARTIPGAKFLAQGTLYPDVIESGQSTGGHAAKIKLHHNVGGLPEVLGFELIEPLRELFKDEVRKMGELLGLPPELVWRHPFPGPGLAVRIIGAVDRDRLSMVRHADAILLEEITAADWYNKIAQALAVLVPVQTVGVMGDEPSYGGQNVVALRMVQTTDFMTADWVHIDYELLGRIATRIMNEVRGVNRVVYDVSSKPPATIEWE